MNKPDLKPCTEWAQKLSVLDRDDLSPSDWAELNTHVASCQVCAAIRANYQTMRKLIQSLPDTELPPRLSAHIFLPPETHKRCTMSDEDQIIQLYVNIRYSDKHSEISIDDNQQQAEELIKEVVDRGLCELFGKDLKSCVTICWKGQENIDSSHRPSWVRPVRVTMERLQSTTKLQETQKKHT